MGNSTGGDRKRKLGRGLGSLIGEPKPISLDLDDPSTRAAGIESQSTSSPHGRGIGIEYLSPGELSPNRHQPRTEFDEIALQSLANSIRSAGIMQPIVARRIGEDRYEIIAGERRWRAAGLIGLTVIPVLIRDVDDQTATEMALIENIQREDLNPIERAQAFAVLASKFGLSHGDIAERVGLDRTTVTNFLRLNELDPKTAGVLRSGRITMGHARALLSFTNIDDRLRMLEQVERFGLSVRELERRIRTILRPAVSTEKQVNDETPGSAHIRDLARRIGDHLGTKVALYEGDKPGSGRMVISFYSFDQFDGLLRRLGFASEG